MTSNQRRDSPLPAAGRGVRLIKRRLLAAGALALFCAFQTASPATVNKTRDGLMLKGYDPVAYFEQGAARRGEAALEYEWMGARWRFSNEANRKLFLKDPRRYAPQYGGYCAYGVSKGYLADIDPRVWKVVDGRLYLNYNAKVGRLWSEDIPGFIARADARWPNLMRK